MPELTQEMLDELPVEMVERVFETYQALRSRWRQGAQTSEAPWARCLGRIAAEVVKRGQELVGQSAFDPSLLAEMTLSSGIVRAMLFGWVLRDAMEQPPCA